jgi:iron(III) transport system permease protein
VTAPVVVALISLPLVYLVLRAGSGGADAWRVLERPRTLELVLRTGVLVAAVCSAAVVIGVPMAWLVTRSDLPGRRVWGVLAVLPLVIPSYVAALALLAALGPRGALQGVLSAPLGVERLPDVTGLPGAVLALTLSTFPYVFLLTAAALRDVDPAFEEAGRSLGRGPGRVLLTVTLPAVRSSIAAGSLLVALYTLSDFGAVSLMGYDSLTRAIFLQYRSLFDRAPAAVLGLVLVALTAMVLVLEERARGRARFHRSAPGTGRVQRPQALGSWRIPALAFCTCVALTALAVPIGVLLLWLRRALERGGELDGVWTALGNSVVASLVAAAVTVVVALPSAILAVRHPRAWTRALERLGYASNALPGIVIALSLVFFGARYAGPLYGTLALLVFAYVVRFYSQATAGAREALLRVGPRLEEAARGLGRGPLGVLRAVTLPLMAPGLLTGATLVFLSAMKELPATLLLRPIGFETLATEVWSATAAGSYSRAAVPALLLIAVSTPFVWLLTARGRARDGVGAG